VDADAKHVEVEAHQLQASGCDRTPSELSNTHSEQRENAVHGRAAASVVPRSAAHEAKKRSTTATRRVEHDGIFDPFDYFVFLRFLQWDNSWSETK
jgi:hypothetical protein